MTENRKGREDIGDLDLWFLPNPKYRLAVRRVEPKWCARYLGTVYIEEGEELSVDSIRQLYGGGKFYIKIKGPKGRYLGHRTLTICGEPMGHGHPVRIASSAEAPVASEVCSVGNAYAQSEQYDVLVAILKALSGTWGK